MAGFNSEELRDDLGRWAKELGGSVPNIHEIEYQGDYHDAMLDSILLAFALKGSVFAKEVRIWTIDGLFRARADAVIRPKNDDMYIFELKTGKEAMPTMDQLGAYRAACTGPHVFSPDPKIAIVGHAPGEIFPQMKVMFAYTEGPGKKIFFFNYCDLIVGH